MSIVIQRHGAAFTLGTAETLFERPGYAPSGRTYDVTSDSSRFLLTKPIKPSVPSARHIEVVLNWSEELKRLVPTR